MSIESKQDWDGLRQVGRIVNLILRDLQSRVRPGITTAELDTLGAARLAHYGARSAPMVLYGFPGALCISLNDEVVHGIPGDRRIHAGDLVTLDLTAEQGGYIADAAITVAVPPVADVQHRLWTCPGLVDDYLLEEKGAHYAENTSPLCAGFPATDH